MWVLPFIDHVAQMQMDDITQTNVDIAIKPSNMESSKSQIQMIEDAIQQLKQGLGFYDKVVVEDCICRH